MQTHKKILLALTPLLLAGCFGQTDQRVVAKLSDENYNLTQQVAALKSESAGKDATINKLRDDLSKGAPPLQTLSSARLAELFTMGGVVLRGGTQAADFGSDGKQDGFRVLIRTKTSEGYFIPIGGTLTVEAFDLAVESGDNRVGKWTFTPEQIKKSWYDGFGLNQFAVNCPWEKPPAHGEITFKIQFVESLTGNVFTDQQKFNVRLAPAESKSGG